MARELGSKLKQELTEAVGPETRKNLVQNFRSYLDRSASSRKRDRNMGSMKMEPLRSLDDFVLESARFQVPDFTNLDRWGTRVHENLIYYQSNYFLMSIIIFLLVGIFHPAQMLLGMIAVGGMFSLYKYATQHQSTAMRFKRDHPGLCFLFILIGGYLVVSLIGSVLVFIFGVLLPIFVTFIHASLRLRNLKNKLANVTEKLSLKSTPMGFLLDELGMTVEEVVKDH